MPIEISMSKAQAIHMDRIRIKRNEKLAELDVTFMKALEAENTTLKTDIVTQKKALRDLPTIFDLTVATTPEELSALWPVGLER